MRTPTKPSKTATAASRRPSHRGHVAPDATPVERIEASTSAVAAAYWVGAGVLAVMAVAAFTLVRRRPVSS